MMMLHSMFFIAGFSIVFILLGASATWIGNFLSSKIFILTKFAGLTIIFFGLFKLGLFPVIFFHKAATFQIRDKRFGLLGALIVGAAFAFGWTPCVGPVLAGVLAYAGTLENVNQGILLLLGYALGLGIPFLLTAAGVNQFFKFFNKIKRYLGLLEKISGIVMVMLGLLIFTGKLILIPAYFPFLYKFAL